MGIPTGTPQILGKTIVGVIKKDNVNPLSSPASQLFLLFSDNTYYELYSSEDIIGITWVQDGGIDEVREYMKGGMKVVFETHLKKANRNVEQI